MKSGLYVLLGMAALMTAHAALADDSLDRDIAQRRFELGRAHYEAGHYEAAIAEFEAANSVVPLPALEYNIARAFDRLDRPEEALVHYRRYLRRATDAESRREVAQRVDTLDARIAAHARTRLRHYLVPGVLAGATVLTASVGAGLLASAVTEFGELDATCGQIHLCERASWTGIQARDYSGEALLGVASALLVVDVALFVLASRRAPARVAAWRPSDGALVSW